MGGDRYSAGLFDDPKHDVHGPGITRTMYSAVSQGCLPTLRSLKSMNFLNIISIKQGIGAMAGTFYGTCAAAWYPDSISSSKLGVAAGFSDFRAVGRTLGRPAMWFSLAAGVFTATECAMEAARNEKRDAWNSLVAGMAGGGIVGSITGEEVMYVCK